MKKRETVKEDTKMNSIPVDEEEKRKREDRKNRFSTPHKVPPIPKRTYAWEGGNVVLLIRAFSSTLYLPTSTT